MFRVMGFFLIIGVLALLGIWLADRPGAVAINWMGWRIETSVAVAAAAIVIVGLTIALLWSGVRLIWRSPRLVARALRQQRARKHRQAIARGLVAVASGDAQGARKYTAISDRSGGDDPLALLLRAQTAQLSGNRAGAEQAFRAMTEQDETRLLGLRGLFVEAQRQGNLDGARTYAEQAARAAPALPWAGQAVFEARCTEGNWREALRALENQMRNGLVDRVKHRRLRAVLLTAQAEEIAEEDAARALTMATEACKLAPGLTPAAVLAGKLSANENNWRKGAKLLEAAWRMHPHPDIAELYAHLRPGGSARDRLARIQHLTRSSTSNAEAALARARAALDAREFGQARAALASLLAQPTRRVALLMAEVEYAEGDEGRAREWTARALRAAPDPAWTADGMVSDRWMPISPVTGRLDAFEWRMPLGQISHEGAVIEGGAPDAGPAPRWLAAPEAPVEIDGPQQPVEATQPEIVAPEAIPASSTGQPPIQEPVPLAMPNVAAPAPEPDSVTRPVVTPANVAVRPARVDRVIPIVHAPDDPGPEPDAAEERSREPRPIALP